MSTVMLVRHGKAADFMSGDYDRLSEMGKQQARLLGEYWAKWDVRIDAVYRGSLRRQRETMEVIERVYREQGLPWPEVTELAGLDEHGGLAVFQHALPRLMEQDEAIREAFLARAAGQKGDPRVGMRAFVQSMHLWIRGEIHLPEVGPFSRFLEGVQDALDTIHRTEGHGKRVAVFTSAGTISAAVGLCYHISAEAIMDLSWQLYNASISEIAVSPKGRGMVSFNQIPHLHTAELLTKV